MWQLIPSLQQCFPTFRGEKHPLREGNLGGLSVSPWFQRAVIVAPTPNCYLLPHQPLLLSLIICIFAFSLISSSSSANDMATGPTSRRHVSDCLWSLVLSRVEIFSGRVRNTLSDCVSSTSQLSGQGSLLSAERKQESEWKRQAQSWGCFFSYSQSTSSSSCCNPAIKIVFHSAFTLYITKATTGFFFSPSLTCWQFSWTKKNTCGQIIYLLSFLPLPLFPSSQRVFGLLWKTILIIWKCGSSSSHCVHFVLCSFPSQSSIDVGLVVLFSEEGETSVSYYPGPSPYSLSNLRDQYTPLTKYTWLALNYLSAPGQFWW